jgi:DNA-binding MarR family transcriptional regulator
MPRSASGSDSSRITAYLDVILLIERLHRQFLEVVSLELDSFGIYDINSVQALILFNIGDAEMTIGELTTRGAYLGSNVSYNVKKMVENGYIVQERSLHDRRSIHVRLTTKGNRLADRLSAMHQRHLAMLTQTGMTDAADLQRVAVTLRQLQQFWLAASVVPLRPGQSTAWFLRVVTSRSSPGPPPRFGLLYVALGVGPQPGVDMRLQDGDGLRALLLVKAAVEVAAEQQPPRLIVDSVKPLVEAWTSASSRGYCGQRAPWDDGTQPGPQIDPENPPMFESEASYLDWSAWACW